MSFPDDFKDQLKSIYQQRTESQETASATFYGRPQQNSTEKIECLFEKKYKYRNDTYSTLPPVNELFKEFYKFDNLQILKRDLNAVKSKLNDYVIEDWSAHTRKKDPSSEIPWKLKSEIQAEFVTVAWCKLFECLHQYNMVTDGQINSLHLCEAPGAFIAALNHHLHSTFDKVNWKWLSTTLNPYYEGNPLSKMIMDDRFMLHTFDHWLFHGDFSGNIISRTNIQNMAKECEERLGKVHLITADGSVDCIDEPDNQEECVSVLHFAEVCAALLILAKGGTFLLKMFTLFEAPSVSLVFFLNCLFEEVNVFKPATSKRGNSEVYLVCLNYKKPDNIDDYLDVMMDKIDCPNIFPLFPKKYIPMDFLLQHEVCTRRFMFEQTKAIESNIHSYEIISRSDNKLCHERRSQVSRYFLERYKVRTLLPSQKILQNPQSKIEYGIKSQIYRGSHTQRLCLKNMSQEQQLFYLQKGVNEIEKLFLWQYEEIACLRRASGENLPLKLFEGKPLEEMQSSLFVAMEILLLRKKIEDFYKIDPVFRIQPVCELGDVDNPKQWSVTINYESKFDGEKQKEFFSQLLKTIMDKEPKRIKLTNVIFLTHYSVSILRYLISNMYDICTISGNGVITLEMIDKSEEATKCIQNIYKTLTEHQNALCFVDILHLHRNQFFRAICDYNNQLLISSYKALLNVA